MLTQRPKPSSQLCLLLLLSVFLIHKVDAASCIPDPAENYEVVFCALKNRGKLPLSPGLEEFRKNPPNMQYLLLKRHAKRNRLKLAPLETSASVARPSLVETDKLPSQQQNNETAVEPCALQGEKIRCGGNWYRWQGNRRNRDLAPDVLDDDFLMALPVRDASYASEEAYLAEAYLRYIQRMHDIGLAGETFTYTRFVTIYRESLKNRSNFAGRFETMYRFLKIDRKTMAVRDVKPASKLFPVSLCSQLEEKFVTCELGRQNHVFIRE